MQIRQAVSSDQRALMAIARQAFPESLRWQLPPRSAVYWQTALAGSAHSGAETWIATMNGEVLGGLVLVTDEIRWAHCRRSTLAMMGCYLRCSGHLPSVTRVMRRRSRLFRAGRLSAGETLDAGRVIPLESRLSTDLGMVRPDSQGHGVGRAFRRHAESRCRSLGRRYMRTMTEADNGAMRHVLDSMQYELVQSRNNVCVYVKDLGTP